MGVVPPILGKLSAPIPLAAHHDISQFDCGVASLNNFLRKRALSGMNYDNARTYVACTGNIVVGYYSLIMAAIARDHAIKSATRNAPDQIGAIKIGRLAVALGAQGRGLGGDLLMDSLRRSCKAADIIGARLVIVDIENDEVSDFYIRHGFCSAPNNPRLLMIPMKEVRSILKED